MRQARRDGRASLEKSIEILSAQAEMMAKRARHIQSMADYLNAKAAWLSGGRSGQEPRFSMFMADVIADAKLGLALPSGYFR